MNTNDVCNVQANQWLFRAIALPLTFGVIIIVGLWAGELVIAWRGLLKMLSVNVSQDKMVKHNPRPMDHLSSMGPKEAYNATTYDYLVPEPRY